MGEKGEKVLKVLKKKIPEKIRPKTLTDISVFHGHRKVSPQSDVKNETLLTRAETH